MIPTDVNSKRGAHVNQYSSLAISLASNQWTPRVAKAIAML